MPNINQSLLNDNQNNYGTVKNTPSSGAKTVIYCVHGKPSSGCCKVLQSEISDFEDNITPRDSISSNAREDLHTTELIKNTVIEVKIQE
ncbi:hypothetical protein HHI36_023300 [Cryptolaemus montrouzieri]|uniref:Uncharacterized protein n=1 Tax=Cryptolaemus montrouzieri TaxID=559131 RepID=A0ABD2PGR4_9CUCU